MFQKGGPKPWQTKIGDSQLDERTASISAEKHKSSLDDDGGKAHVVRKDGTIGTLNGNEV